MALWLCVCVLGKILVTFLKHVFPFIFSYWPFASCCLSTFHFTLAFTFSSCAKYSMLVFGLSTLDNSKYRVLEGLNVQVNGKSNWLSEFFWQWLHVFSNNYGCYALSLPLCVTTLFGSWLFECLWQELKLQFSWGWAFLAFQCFGFAKVNEEVTRT